ncbi:MAG: type II toxin-antitoxin system VapC family toxin [Leptolyngbya sp. SIO4C1]|nr:type II toxin-antitoxin system VapC family toxin [Leptolyngbya sp. SIO4C1]
MKAGAVLDASALLAWMFNEPDKKAVSAALEKGCLINAVNWCEVIQKANQRDIATPLLYEKLRHMQILDVALSIIELTEPLATAMTGLSPLTKPYGLSLGDRACLALGQRKGIAVLTTDIIWKKLDVGVDIQLI